MRNCHLCGAPWVEVSPDGYRCPRHGLITREELAKVVSKMPAGPEDYTRILSAASRDGVLAERIEGPRFRSAKELSEATSSDVPWIARPWVARGAITELDGKVKTSGKTTWLTHLVRCVLDGIPFMGQPTTQTKVVYLSEQGDTSFKEALRRAGLLTREDLSILAWKEAMGFSWDTLIDAAIDECHRVDSGLLVVDTLPQFAGIEGDGENSSGQALQAVRPLQTAAVLEDLAVIVSRHERKSGGEVGDSGRGSSAFAGAADIVLSLRRPEGNASPNLRVLHGVGRFDGIPDSLVIELTEGGYRALGSEHALGAHRARVTLEDLLPRGGDNAVSIEEVVASAGLSRTAVQEALKGMIEDHVAVRCGTGTKGNSFRYYLQ